MYLGLLIKGSTSFALLGQNPHYSVYLGLESGSGDLFAIYEWVLQFKTAKKGAGVDSRRIKQVCFLLCTKTLL